MVCVFLIHQKTGNAIRALGRMATLSASRRNSSNNLSSSNSPRASISANNPSRMSSLNEEDSIVTKPNSDDTNSQIVEENNNRIDEDLRNIESKLSPEVIKNPDKDFREKKTVRSRVCSERSDSGFSDCSIHNTSSCSCTSTPLLRKKFQINEEPEFLGDAGSTTSSETSEKSRNDKDIHDEVFQIHPSLNGQKKLDGQISKIAEKFENLSRDIESGNLRNSFRRRASDEVSNVAAENQVHFSKLEVKLTPVLPRKVQIPQVATPKGKLVFARDFVVNK